MHLKRITLEDQAKTSLMFRKSSDFDSPSQNACRAHYDPKSLTISRFEPASSPGAHFFSTRIIFSHIIQVLEVSIRRVSCQIWRTSKNKEWFFGGFEAKSGAARPKNAVLNPHPPTNGRRVWHPHYSAPISPSMALLNL